MRFVLLYNLVQGTRPGSIFIEAAPFLSKEAHVNKYDWENKKISFQITTNDLDNILFNLQETFINNDEVFFNIIKNNKTLYFCDNTLTITCASDNNIITHQLSKASLYGMSVLLKQAKARLYNW